MVLSSPKYAGSLFQWQPVRIRKIIASSILRGSCLLRPVGLGGSSSLMSGLISSQRSSGTSQIVSSVSCFDMTSPAPDKGLNQRIAEVLNIV